MSDEADDADDEVLRASDIGGEGPPIEEKPYKIVFEANKCFRGASAPRSATTG